MYVCLYAMHTAYKHCLCTNAQCTYRVYICFLSSLVCVCIYTLRMVYLKNLRYNWLICVTKYLSIWLTKIIHTAWLIVFVRSITGTNVVKHDLIVTPYHYTSLTWSFLHEASLLSRTKIVYLFEISKFCSKCFLKYM